MTINTYRFGPVEIDEKTIISFSDGLPGLEGYKHFTLLQVEGSYPIIWLQSTENGDICLPVIDSFLIMPNYFFDISDDDVKQLSLAGPEDYKVISVLVIPENIEQMTINLAAPIIINTKNGQARQIILNSGNYGVRCPIFKEITKLIKGDDADAGSVKKAE